MVEDSDNPLDDELLKELGLAPKEAPQPPKPLPPKPSASSAQARGPTASAAGGPPATARGAPPQRRPGIPETKLPSSPATARQGPPPAQTGEQFQQGLSHLSEDIPVQVVAVLGKRSMTLKDLIALKQGEIIELKKLPQETIDLVANGKLMARGELVLVDGKLGIQIKQLVG